MFYAALELRCGIERRMKQYLDTQTHISKAKRSGWEIAKLAKGIEAAFRTGDQVVEFCVMDKVDGKVLTTLLYTPVTDRLQKLGKQLGNYLHATTAIEWNEAKWTDFRSKLGEAAQLLRMATTGELLGAPLLQSETGKIKISGEFEKGDKRLSMMQSLFDSRSNIFLRVEYHKKWKFAGTPNAG
jgi:hypothetical protein